MGIGRLGSWTLCEAPREAAGVHISFSFCPTSEHSSPYSVTLQGALRWTNSVMKSLPLVSEAFPLSVTSQLSTAQLWLQVGTVTWGDEAQIKQTTDSKNNAWVSAD